MHEIYEVVLVLDEICDTLDAQKVLKICSKYIWNFLHSVITATQVGKHESMF